VGGSPKEEGRAHRSEEAPVGDHEENQQIRCERAGFQRYQAEDRVQGNRRNQHHEDVRRGRLIERSAWQKNEQTAGSEL